MNAFDNPNSWINRQPVVTDQTPMIETNYGAQGPSFAGGGDYYYPDGRVPSYYNRTLDVGHNAYSMPGSYEAQARYGVPGVVVQSDPYARIAYQVGPHGVMPMVGYPSVYPHVLDATRVHYGDYRNNYIRGLLGASDFSFTDMMNRAERMLQMAMRARMAGAGGSASSQKKTDTTEAKKDDDTVALPPEGVVTVTPVPQPDLPQTVELEHRRRQNVLDQSAGKPYAYNEPPQSDIGPMQRTEVVPSTSLDERRRQRVAQSVPQIELNPNSLFHNPIPDAADVRRQRLINQGLANVAQGVKPFAPIQQSVPPAPTFRPQLYQDNTDTLTGVMAAPVGANEPLARPQQRVTTPPTVLLIPKAPIDQRVQ